MRFKEQIRVASGYIYLGLMDDAHQTLDEIAPEHGGRPEILSLRAQIYFTTREWNSLKICSWLLASNRPYQVQNWLWLAHSTRICDSVLEAENVLDNALIFHPKEGNLYYLLSSYALLRGEKVLAKERLATAILLDPDLRLKALADPDFDVLW